MMSNELAQLLSVADQRMRRRKEELETKEKVALDLDIANSDRIVELAKAIFPAGVAECISWHGWQDYFTNSNKHEHAALLVSIPTAAPILAIVRVEMSDECAVTDIWIEEDNRRYNLPFLVCHYEPVQDHDSEEWVVDIRVGPGYSNFDGVLIDALEIGNNKDIAQAQADERNRKAREPKPVVEEPALFCPLLHMGENSIGRCLRTQCAWWAEHYHACAIQGLAGRMYAEE